MHGFFTYSGIKAHSRAYDEFSGNSVRICDLAEVDYRGTSSFYRNIKGELDVLGDSDALGEIIARAGRNDAEDHLFGVLYSGEKLVNGPVSADKDDTDGRIGIFRKLRCDLCDVAGLFRIVDLERLCSGSTKNNQFNYATQRLLSL